NRSQRGRRGQRIQRIRFHTFNVVEIQFGDQRHVEADLFASLRESLYIRPSRLHIFVLDVAQPSAEDGQPISVPHRGPPVTATRSVCCVSWRIASAIRKSASRA